MFSFCCELNMLVNTFLVQKLWGGYLYAINAICSLWIINEHQSTLSVGDGEWSHWALWPLLLTWINFNPSMDK